MPKLLKSYDDKSTIVPVAGFILGFALVILLTISLFRTLSNTSTDLSFTGMLNYFSSVPSMQFVNIADFTIVADWGIFNFLKNFLNLFAYLFGFSIWFSQNIYNLILWLFYMVRYLLLI